MEGTKPFCISKQVVWESYKKVKANKGSAGVDDISLKDFEECLKDNLYKIWNRMSSGSYFPPPVKRVEIPKGIGSTRPLGIPTVGDRIAQTVVKMYLEPLVEPSFHPDSYGYRPGKSATDAVGMTRRRCWSSDWVIDMDIKGFFDNIDHELMMRAVKKYTDCKWILLYVGRWLKAPVILEDGTEVERSEGVPQGGVASPLLANIFLHHAFDKWMDEMYPSIKFERYADDIIVHCESKSQAHIIRKAIEKRLKLCKLELHPQKTKIVYCKDEKRCKEYPEIAFDFLGYTFRPRMSMTRKGDAFIGFNPAVSKKALKSMSDEIRAWKYGRRSDLSMEDIAKTINPIVRGWINYYGKYRPSEMFPIYRQLFHMQVKWSCRKYKKLRSYRRAKKWLQTIAKRDNSLFVYWKWWYRMDGGITRAV